MDQNLLPGIVGSNPLSEPLDKYLWCWKVDRQDVFVTTIGKNEDAAKEELARAICESCRTTRGSLRDLFYTLRRERKIKLIEVKKLS